MSDTKVVVITGAESTGKSTLTYQLGKYYKAPYILEIARNFIANLNRDYTKKDVIEIARLQIRVEEEMLKEKPEYLFLDTDLIITKIWLLHVFNYCPDWIDDYLKKTPRHCHLVCYYDLEWESDPLRENPHLRTYLHNRYLDEIIKLNLPYSIVKGHQATRFTNALKALKKFNHK